MPLELRYKEDGTPYYADTSANDIVNTLPTSRITVRPQGNYDYWNDPLSDLTNAQQNNQFQYAFNNDNVVNGLPVQTLNTTSNNTNSAFDDTQPLQPLSGYVHSTPVPPQPLPTQPIDWSIAPKAISNLFTDVDGRPRFQTWPEVMVRSAVTAPHDALTGQMPFTSGYSKEDYLSLPPEQNPLLRAQDVAGIMGGGTMFERPVKPVLPVEPLSKSLDMTAMQRQQFNGRKAPDGRLLSDTSSNAPISALERMGFRSAAKDVLTNAKMDKGTGEQWINYLKNNGVKKEEIENTGLDALPKTDQFTRDQLLEHVNNNQVQFNEIIKGKYEPDKLDDKQYGKDLDRIAVRDFGQIYDHLVDSQQQQVRQAALESQNQNPTKFSRWQLPGGENYRETLLTLPNKKPINNKVKWEDLTKKEQESYIGLHEDSTAELTDEHRNDPNYYANDVKSWYENLIAPNAELQGYHTSLEHFQSTHWNEPNVLAHARMNDRIIQDPSGNHGPLKSLHIEEIQSDWHQKGRSEGYKGEAAKLRPEFDKIENKILASKDEAIMANPDLDEALKLAVDKKIINAAEANLYKRYSQIEPFKDKGVPEAPFKSSWSDVMLKRLIRQAVDEGKDAISWTPGEAQAARYDLSKQVENIRLEHYPDSMQLFAHDKNGNTILTKQVKNSNELSEYIGKEAAEKLLNQEKKPVGRGNIPTQFLENADLKVGGEGMKGFYDKMLVDKANNIAKKYGSKVEDAATDVSGGKALNSRDHSDLFQDGIAKVKVLKLTSELKEAANRGFNLYSDTDVSAPLAALAKQRGVELNPVEHNPFTDTTYHGTRNFEGTNLEPKMSVDIHHDTYTGKDEYRVWDTINKRYMSNPFDTKAEAEKFIEKSIGTEFFSTPNPKLAQGYSYAGGLGSQILPLKIDSKDYHVFDAGGKTWQYANSHAIKEADQLGKKGVIIKNVVDNPDLGKNYGPQTVYITLDPSTVRSKFAKFDPAKYGESGLLKAGGLPLITNENGQPLDHKTLQPLKDYLANPDKENPDNPLPTHKALSTEDNVGMKYGALAAAKAAEWAAFVGARKYPKISGPLYASWVAQWPIMSQLMRHEVNRQIKAGVAPKDVEFSPGSIGDMFGILSSLDKKYGKGISKKLTPVEQNPFEVKKPNE